MRVAVEIGMHGASEKSSLATGLSLQENPPQLPKDPSVALDIFVANDLAVALERRHVDKDLESSFPGFVASVYDEDQNAFSIRERYHDLPPEKQYDAVIPLHNCYFRNGRRISITPDSLTVSRRSLAIASLWGIRRVVFSNSNFHRTVGLTGIFDLEIPICKPENEKRQIAVYRKKFIDLALRDVRDLPQVDLAKFTFYSYAFEIPKQQAEELALEEIPITRAFQQLPTDVVDRLGMKTRVPLYALSWNYNHFGDIDEDGEKRKIFGQVVHKNFFDYAVRRRYPDLLRD